MSETKHDLEVLTGAVVPSWQEWEYNDFVRAGLEVQSRASWLLGDLAAAVETKYGEATLVGYAKDIGEAYGTLRRHRDVSRAYPPQSAPRGAVSYSVARALAAQPDRLELLAGRDDWTKREAEELVQGRQPKPEPRPNPPRRTRRPLPGPEPGKSRRPPQRTHHHLLSSLVPELRGTGRALDQFVPLDDSISPEQAAAWSADLAGVSRAIGKFRKVLDERGTGQPASPNPAVPLTKPGKRTAGIARCGHGRPLAADGSGCADCEDEG